MAGPEQKERPSERLPIREQLRTELRDSLAFYESPEDSLAYGHAAEAIKVLVTRGLDAADSVEKELKRQDTLEDGDKRKMPPEERKKYEDMLTQVETWAISLPEMLRQARVVQSHPQVRERLWDIFRLVSEREKFMQELQGMRFIVLKGSDRNPGSPFESAVPKEFYELAAIATTGWIVREQIHIHPELLSNDRKAERSLFLQNVELLGDTEVEGGWTVGDDEAGPLDEFLLKKTGARFIRDKEPDVERRRAAMIELFKQGRVKVNNEKVPESTPKRPLKEGDTVTLLTTFARKTERVQTGVEEARIETDETRKVQNAERGTQNFPGVEQLAYNPAGVMAVWKRLLESGGGIEQKRYARQLRGDLEEFNADFLQKGALEEFRKNALEIKEDMVNKNERAKQFVKFWLWLSGKTVSETVAERLTTNKEEFDQIFEETMKKMEGEFDQLGSPQNKATLRQLQDLLGCMEAGQQVDRARLNTLIDAYTAMHRTIGGTLVRLQSWQVRENMDRVGGAQKPNNLDLALRTDNKSSFERLRSLAPFGAFERLSFIDPEGRIILVEPDQMTPAGIALDTGKLIAETAGTSLALSHLLTRIPYLSRIPGFNRLMGRVAVPIVLAEGSRTFSNKMANNVRVRMAGNAIEDYVSKLEEISKKSGSADRSAQVEEARVYAEKIFPEMTVLLHVASSLNPEGRRLDLVIESHLYTNQLLEALGFPPMLELRGQDLPDSADALKKRLKDEQYGDIKISPEVELYLAAKESDRSLARDRAMDKIRQQRHEVRLAVDEWSEEPVELLQRGLLDNYMLSPEKKDALRKDMISVRDSDRFKKNSLPKSLEHLGSNDQERTTRAYAIAGDVWMTHHKWQKMFGMMGMELKRAPRPADFDLGRQFPLDAKGRQKFSPIQVQMEVQDLMKKYSIHDILAISQLIADHPPADETLVRQWFNEESFSDSNAQRRYLAQLFGPSNNRSALGESFIAQWIELYAYYETYGLNTAYDATREINLSRIVVPGFKLFKLPGEYWMVIKPEIEDGGATGALLVEIGENSGKGDGRSSPRGQFVISDRTFECNADNRSVRIDPSLLYPGMKVTVNDGNGKPLAQEVPLLLQLPKAQRKK